MDLITNIVNTFEFESIFRLFLGFILAGIIGIERSSWNKPAGFRTHALVGLSAVLITLCGEYMSQLYNIDPSRIPAQLISGIGFLGAGTILRDGFNVKGLTTAAGLLAVTCVGLSIGAGFYIGGIVTTIIVYFILSSSYKISDKLDHFNLLTLNISAKCNPEGVLNQVEKIFSDFDLDIKQLKRLEDSNTENETTFKIIGQYNKRGFNKNNVVKKISLIENVVEVLED